MKELYRYSQKVFELPIAKQLHLTLKDASLKVLKLSPSRCIDHCPFVQSAKQNSRHP